MNTYNVIMLGPSGSGKTVFLSSLYNKLSTQGELGFFLDIDTEKRQRLKKLYTQIANEEKWPDGSIKNFELTFTCRVQTKSLSIHSACRFQYLDYAGGNVTDEYDPEFEEKVKSADTLLCLLDGQKISSLMLNEAAGTEWVTFDLDNMLSIMQRSSKSIHFVISKWDLLEEDYTLGAIRTKLLQIEGFKNLVNSRRESASGAIRLIPVSSVGKGFATLQADGKTMLKKVGFLPQPFQVEVPLAFVLPDAIIEGLKQLQEEEEKIRNSIEEVKPNLNLFDWVGKIVGKGLRATQNLLPKKYHFIDDKTLLEIIKVIETPANQKKEDAVKRTEELKAKQAESLKLVSDEETALRYTLDCFRSIVNKFDYQFPESNLKDL